MDTLCNLWLNDIQNDISLELCRIMNELHKNQDVFIIREPAPAVLHHMRLGVEVEKYIGYTNESVLFSFKDYIIFIYRTDYYPAHNSNGYFSFNISLRRGLTKKQLCANGLKYHGFQSISNWLVDKNYSRIEKNNIGPIVIDLSEKHAQIIISDIRAFGHSRENQIINSKPLFLPTGIWNGRNKIVQIISGKLDNEGRRQSFYYDIVKHAICG